MHFSIKIIQFAMLWLLTIVATTLSSCGFGKMPNEVIIENEDITVTSDSVTMGPFSAFSPDGMSITTNYERAAIDSIGNVIKFRLLIGQRDIELLPAQFHYIDLDKAAQDTSIVAFEPDTLKPKSTHNVAMPVKVEFNIDMSHMLKKLKEDKIFVTPTCDTIHLSDFENARIDLAITTSDKNISHKLSLDNAEQNNGIYPVKFTLEPRKSTKYTGWSANLETQSSAMPSYTSKQNIMNAIYNMSVELIEAGNHDTAQPTLVASQCYDIALSLAYLQPHKSMQTLKAMVVDSVVHSHEGPRTFADMGNDLIWSQAAWSVYCATGDKTWLSYVYKVIAKSLKKINTLISSDNDMRLYHALSPYTSRFSHQYYPEWATTTHAYETMPLVANAIIQHSYTLLGQIADEFELNEDYDIQASRIKDAINHRLWNENRGCYTQYLYGGVSSIMSPCVDNMGQAMAILWDIADDDRTEAIMNETPITRFGVPLIHPNRSGVGTGLNNTITPMMQAMWNVAAAKAGNMSVLRRGLGALIYQQALAASCSTCCNATTGEILDGDNPQGNAAGNIAMVLRVIAGMNFLPGGIELNPKVPVCFNGDKKISSFVYRKAILNITIKGTGDEWSTITIDGKELADNFINGNLEGEHDIVITMNNQYAGSGGTTLAQKMKELPETPKWLWNGFYGTNYTYSPALGYRILINGEPTYAMRDSVLGTRDTVTYRNYSIVAINKYGNSYISMPHYITTSARCYRFAPHYPKLVATTLPSSLSTLPSSLSPIELDDTTTVTIPVVTSEPGDYIIDVAYSNGNGPRSLSQQCELLRVSANSHNQGVVAVPQTGTDQWLNKTYSSHLKIKLLKGKNQITLSRVKAWGENSPASIILLYHMRLIKQHNVTR